MPPSRVTAIIVACAALGFAQAGCGGGDGGAEPTPGVTTIGLQTQVSALVTPFPTPVVNGSTVDSSASKGYTATFPAGWNFYPNRIQTRDASADVAFEPLTVGATAQASIVVNCITVKSDSPEEHVRFEATKIAQIGTNTGTQISQRQVSGMEATVVSYRFQSANEANIPVLDKQDILFTTDTCDWIITTTVPEGRRAEFESQFNAFLDSFRLTG